MRTCFFHFGTPLFKSWFAFVIRGIIFNTFIARHMGRYQNFAGTQQTCLNVAILWPVKKNLFPVTQHLRITFSIRTAPSINTIFDSHHDELISLYFVAIAKRGWSKQTVERGSFGFKQYIAWFNVPINLLMVEDDLELSLHIGSRANTSALYFCKLCI